MTEHEYNEKINELFTEWKAEQKSEKEYKVSNVDIGSFTFDGAISPEDYFSAKDRILFVSKESDEGGKNKNYYINQNTDKFWLKNVYLQKERTTKFSSGISMLANALISNDFKTPNKSHDVLKYISFINLNKRGGYSSCDWKVLKKYVETYRRRISYEIKLLNPTLIVCAGKWLKWYLEEVVELKGKYKIIEVYHPSYFIKSNNEHLKKLEEEIVKIR